MKILKKLSPALLIVSALIISSCEKEKVIEPKEIIRPVKVRVIGEGKITSSNNTFSGIAEGIHQSVLSFRVSGVLNLLNFDVGQNVKAKTIAAVLDDRDYKIKVQDLENQLKAAEAKLEQLQRGAREEDLRIYESRLFSAQAAVKSARSGVNSAQSNLDASRSEYQRVTQLYTEQIATKRALDTAKADLDVKTANLEQSQNQLSQAKQNVETAEKELEKAKVGGREEEVRAQIAQVRSMRANHEQALVNLQDTKLLFPFDGIISKKHQSNFQQVAAGNPIYTIVDTKQIEVQISIPESQVNNVNQGQEVNVNFLNFPKVNYKGKISKIGITADQQTLTYPVFIKVENEDHKIKPGMTADVVFSVDKTKSVYPTVPIHTILQDKINKSRYVWIYNPKNQTTQKTDIVLGALKDDEVEVIKGLNFGDILITAGVHEVREGMKVRVLAK